MVLLTSPVPAELVEAVLGRLATIPGLTVLDGQVSSTPAGAYAVFYDDAPRLTSRSLDGTSNRASTTFYVVCAGRDPGETRWVVSQVLGALVNWRPLPSRSSSWLTLVPNGAPLLPDESVAGDVRFSQTLTFRHTTTRS